MSRFGVYSNVDLLKTRPLELPAGHLDRLAVALADRIVPATVERIAAGIVALLPDLIRGLVGGMRGAPAKSAGRSHRPKVSVTSEDFEQTRAFQRRLGRTS